VTHFAESVTIRVAGAGTMGWWGIQGVRLETAVSHPSPPAPPAPPGMWTAPVHEDWWPDATGWTGSSLAVSTCGHFGTMLGGYGGLNASAYVEKTFTNLPAHSSLRLQLTFTRVDRLDTGLIYVDGAETWRHTFGIYFVTGSEHVCGAAETGEHYQDIQVKVDVMVTHFAESVTIRVAGAGTMGWWGIQGVRLETAVPHP